ncbi:hypothetical protein ABIE45_006250 [Methylobacterium sp. OAE515]|uniref:hypothetical protein n=1 Tax=Methylobacterium sp. OAE515 TaxID=2817895 RepID=UPI00178AF5D0
MEKASSVAVEPDISSPDERYLSASAIRDRCPLIVSAAVQAGDILLTRGPGHESALIAAATGGLYSHAAIWLPFRLEDEDGKIVGQSLHLIESDDHGVGESYPERLYLEGEIFHRQLCYCTAPGTKSALLLRHKNIHLVSQEEIISATRSLKESEFYKAYSELHRLLEATKFVPTVRKALELFLRFQDRADINLVTGSFCSELVAKFFKLLNLDLYNFDQAPSSISPNDLSRSALLCAVAGAVINKDQVSDSATAYRSRYTNVFKRDVILPGFVRQNSLTIRFSEKIAALNSHINSEMIGILRLNINTAAQQAERVRDMSAEASADGDLRATASLSQIFGAYRLAGEIYSQRLVRRASGRENGLPGISAEAELKLENICSDLMIRSNKRLSTTHSLMGIRKGRALYREGGETPVLHEHLTTLRLGLLTYWLEYRQKVNLNQPPEDLPDDGKASIIDGNSDASTIEGEVNDVLCAALNAVVNDTDDATYPRGN